MFQARLSDVFARFAVDQPQPPVKTLGNFVSEFWPILVPVVLGFVAIYLLLPRARGYAPLWGATLGGAALIFAGWSLIRVEKDLAETILFYAFSAVAIVAGVLLITQRNPARAALSFAMVVLSTCGLFLLQAAPFLMAATTIIYAGAIVVTFLFVLMLAQQAGISDADQRSREPLLSAVAGFVLLGGLLCVLQRTYDPLPLAGLDEKFAKAEKAGQAKSVEEMQKTLGDDDTYFRDFLQEVDDIPRSAQQGKLANSLATLKDAIREAQAKFNDRTVPLAEKAAQFQELSGKRAQLLYTLGSLQPPGNLPLSANSGLRPNLPVQDIPRDAEGKPVMPATNVADLGKSLFTDYLLPVELAGTLLLVAVIGAIAIAGRRTEGLR
jgi:NADH:ubiquinone oxidoreductase subunit 6 (subunit J)